MPVWCNGLAQGSSKPLVGVRIPAWVQLGMWCKWSARMFEAHQDTVQFGVFPQFFSNHLTNTIPFPIFAHMKLLKHNTEKGTDPVNFSVKADLSTLLVISVEDINKINLTNIIKLRGYNISAILLPNELLTDDRLEEEFYNGELWNMIKVQLTENTSLIYY